MKQTSMTQKGERVRAWRKSGSLWAFTLVLLVAILACSLPSDRTAASLDQTKVALEVEATTMAIERLRLTREAEGGEPPPAQPPGDTPEPPPPATEEPPPATEESQPETEEPEPSEPAGVPGSLERAPFDPAYDWGQGHDAEDFDGSQGFFPASSAGAANSWYEDGRYHISFTSRNRWTWYWSFLDGSDFYVDVLVFNGENCVPADTAGLVFRGDSDWDYGIMFGISCGGEYFIGFTAIPGEDGVICNYETGGINCLDRDLFPSDLLQTGPGAVNRIGVMADGQDLDFYINGKWVANRSLAMYWPAFERGEFALYLGSAQKPDAAVSFDDFSIWYLP